ncbi:MAG: FadR family transcriptional regulator [Deltaproteobacteria bacterium]|nr:FadR family transcriptional regulator [Deltaproteobacteria bacterium]
MEERLFSKYEPKRASDGVAEEIKKAILNKQFKKGDRLPSERSLAEQFGVGRMTVREAIRTLETQDFIKIKKGCEGGPFVGNADPGAVASMLIDNMVLEGLTREQMTEARIGLQRAVIESAIHHATQYDLDRIAGHLEDSSEILGPDHAKTVVSRMINFHILVAEASHNLPYIMFTRTLMEWARRRIANWIPTPEIQLYCYQSHKKTFNAIKHKNIKLAKQYIKEHIEYMSRYVGDCVE